MGSRAWSPTLKMVSTRAAPSSRPGSTSFAPTTQRQPNRRTPALQRKHTTTRQAQPASTSRRVPGAEVRSACRLPEWFRLGPLLRRGPAQPASLPTTQRQPNRRPPVFPTGTPAQPSNASATAQVHDRKASATSFGTAVSTRAARSSRPGSTSFGERDSPRHIRADSINSMENGHKNRGFCPPFGHFLKSTPPRPRHRP